MIVVTGGTGHIGNVLLRELVNSGQRVRAMVLPGEDRTPISALDVEIVSGDIRDADATARIFRGADLVYHLAGIVSILPGQSAALNEVNVRGTANVIEACLKTGVPRLVYTSSIHALAEPPHGIVINESRPFDPACVLGDYARSKACATLEVLRGVRRGLDAVVVCPTGVIGPYDYKVSEMGQLILDFLRKRLKMFVNGAYDFVDVRDVATGIVLAGAKGRRGESYILSGERITVRGLLDTLEKITGIKAPTIRIPAWLARTLGDLATPYYRLVKTKPLFTSYSIDVLKSNSLVSSDKAKRDLGYSARPIRESISDAVMWFSGQSSTLSGQAKRKGAYAPAG